MAGTSIAQPSPDPNCVPPIPPGLADLTEELALEVVSQNPAEIITFLADYLNRKLGQERAVVESLVTIFRNSDGGHNNGETGDRMVLSVQGNEATDGSNAITQNGDQSETSGGIRRCPSVERTEELMFQQIHKLLAQVEIMTNAIQQSQVIARVIDDLGIQRDKQKISCRERAKADAGKASISAPGTSTDAPSGAPDETAALDQPSAPSETVEAAVEETGDVVSSEDESKQGEPKPEEKETVCPEGEICEDSTQPITPEAAGDAKSAECPDGEICEDSTQPTTPEAGSEPVSDEAGDTSAGDAAVEGGEEVSAETQPETSVDTADDSATPKEPTESGQAEITDETGESNTGDQPSEAAESDLAENAGDVAEAAKADESVEVESTQPENLEANKAEGDQPSDSIDTKIIDSTIPSDVTESDQLEKEKRDSPEKAETITQNIDATPAPESSLPPRDRSSTLAEQQKSGAETKRFAGLEVASVTQDAKKMGPDFGEFPTFGSLRDAWIGVTENTPLGTAGTTVLMGAGLGLLTYGLIRGAFGGGGVVDRCTIKYDPCACICRPPIPRC